MNRLDVVVPLAIYLLATVGLGWATGRWSEVIYFLTGLILVWYTWETRHMRLATLRQTTLQIRPFLAIEYGEERKIWVHNLGNGVARDPEHLPVAVDRHVEHRVEDVDPVDPLLEVDVGQAVGGHVAGRTR